MLESPFRSSLIISDLAINFGRVVAQPGEVLHPSLRLLKASDLLPRASPSSLRRGRRFGSRLVGRSKVLTCLLAGLPPPIRMSSNSTYSID